MGHGNFFKRPIYRHIMYHGDIRLEHFDGTLCMLVSVIAGQTIEHQII